MSIRISKEIVYFLNNIEAEAILKPNYLEILEQLDGDSEFIEETKAKLISLLEEKSSNQESNNYISYIAALHDLKKGFEDSTIELYQLIKLSFDYDQIMGVSIIPPQLIEYRRFDDLIDYYENIDQTYKVDYLNSPIYPFSHYYYTGFDTDEKKLLSTYEANQAICKMYGKSANITALELKELYSQSPYFKPEIDPLAYCLAKSSGILKDGISEYQFNLIIRAAIITSWG